MLFANRTDVAAADLLNLPDTCLICRYFAAGMERGLCCLNKITEYVLLKAADTYLFCDYTLLLNYFIHLFNNYTLLQKQIGCIP